MQVSEWISIVTAFIALIGAIASAFWGQHFAQAKEAQIAAKDEIIRAKEALIETLRFSQDELLRSKDARIEALAREVEFLQQITPMKLREYFLSVKQQLEEYNEFLAKQLEDARSMISQKDKEILALQERGAEASATIVELKVQRDRLMDYASTLERKLASLQNVQQQMPYSSHKLFEEYGLTTPF